MRPIAVSGLPLGAVTGQCWSAALNEQLIAECEKGSPICSPQTVAKLLSLDYCPGECSGSTWSKPSTTTLVVGAAAMAVVLALVLRRKGHS